MFWAKGTARTSAEVEGRRLQAMVAVDGEK